MRYGNKNREFACVTGLVAIDLLALSAAFTLAFFSRKILNLFFAGLIHLDHSLYFYFRFWWIPLIFVITIAYEKLYTKRLSFWDETRGMIKAVTVSIVIVLAIVSLGKLSNIISRLVILFLWFYSLLLFPLFRLLGKKILLVTELWRENAIIIGAGSAGTETAKGIMREAHLGYRIIGFLDDDEAKKGSEILIDNKAYKVFGKISHFRKFVGLLNISTVIIAIPSLSLQKMSEITSEVQRYTKSVLLVPDLKGIALLNTELYNLFMQQLFLMKINNNLKSYANRFVKRSFDIFFSILLLPVVLLVTAAIGVFIKLGSAGPVFFVQERIGENRKKFRCIKFRTMYVNSGEILKDYLKDNDSASREWDRYKKLREHDPRLTKAGKFLRRTSLDELPQIFNVMKGEMSLFGPRPYLPEEEIDMKDYGKFILMTRPGITGLWQVSGRNNLEFEDRLKLDSWYVLNWSLWLDIVILFKTVRVVLNKEGAY